MEGWAWKGCEWRGVSRGECVEGCAWSVDLPLASQAFDSRAEQQKLLGWGFSIRTPPLAPLPPCIPLHAHRSIHTLPFAPSRRSSSEPSSRSSSGGVPAARTARPRSWATSPPSISPCCRPRFSKELWRQTSNPGPCECGGRSLKSLQWAAALTRVSSIASQNY